MTDTEIPADLLDYKREFNAVTYELATLSRTMPSGVAILAGEATEDPADRERWNELYARQGELAELIHRHPAFAGLSQIERYNLDKSASKAARAAV